MSDRTLGRLIVRLAVELAKYKADWQEAEKATRDGAAAIEGKSADASKAVDKLSDSAERNAGALGEMGDKAKVAIEGVKSLTGLSTAAVAGLGALGAAAAVAGVAALKGAQEQRQLADAILLTGNHAGLVAGQLDRMAMRIASSINGSVQASRDVLAGLVSTGKFTVQSLGEVGSAVQLVARFSVQTNEQVLKHFAGMGDGVAKWAAKTNESYHFLDSAQLRYIQRLEDQGDKQAAMRATSEALSSHLGGDLTRNLGYVESAWQAIQRAASDAWTAMKDAGKDRTTQEIFEASNERLQNAASGLAARSASGRDRLARMREENFGLFRRMEREGRVASDATAQHQAQQEETKALDEETKFWKQYATKVEQRDKEIEKVVALGQKRGWTAAQLADAKARVNDRFKERERKGPADPNEQIIKGARERLAVLDAEEQATEKLTEAEKDLVKYQAAVAAGYWENNKVAAELLTTIAARTKAKKEEAEADKRDAREAKEAANERAQLIEASEKNAGKIEDEAEKLRLHSAALGLNKQAVAELEAAKLEELAASKERQAAFHEEYTQDTQKVEALRREAAAYRDLAAAKRGAAAKEVAVDAAKAERKAWQETGDFIEGVLTDSLRSGFDHGKKFSDGFFDSLKTTAKTTVITIGVRYAMSAVGLPTSSRGAGVMNLLGGGGSSGFRLPGFGGANGFGFPDVGTFISDGIGGIAGNIGNALGFGSGLGGTAIAAGEIAGTVAATESGLIAAGASAAEASAAAGALGGTMGAGGGLAAAAGAALPIIGAGLAIASLFDKKRGGPKSEGFVGTGGMTSSWNGPMNSKVAPFVQGVRAQFDAAMQAFGGSATGSFGLGASTDPQGTSPSFVEQRVAVNGRDVLYDMNHNVGRSEEELQAALDAAAKNMLLQAIRAADLPGALGNLLRQDMTVAADRVSKIVTERAALDARLIELTTSPLEKLNRARQAERDAIDQTNRLKLAQVHAEEDLQRTKSALLDTYSREGVQLRAWAQELRAFRDALVLGDSSPLGAVAKLSEAARQFDQTLAAANAGDADARGRLTGRADAYLAAAMSGASSRAEYDAIFGQVTAALTMTAASADSQATIQEDQLKQLGLLNEKVQTWAEAWAAYVTAKDAAAAASAAVAAENASYVGAAPAAAADAPAALSAEEQFRARFGQLFWGGDMSTPGFAAGGMHLGGARLVGEDGPELEVTGPARIFNARQTQEILRGAGGADPQLATLLRQILEELRSGSGDQVRLSVKLAAHLDGIERRLKKFDVVGPEYQATTA